MTVVVPQRIAAVAPAQRVQVATSVATFGGAVGASAARAGAIISAAADEQRVIDLKQLQNSYNRDLRDFNYGIDGIKRKKNQDYLNAIPGAETGMQKLREGYGDRIGDSETKRLFNQWAEGKNISEGRVILNDGIQIRDDVHAQTLETVGVDAREDFAISGGRDDLEQESRDRIINSTEELMDRNGVRDPATRQRIIDEKLGAMYVLTVDTLIKRGSHDELNRARELLDKNKGVMDAAQHAALSADLDGRSDLGEAFDHMDRILAEFSDPAERRAEVAKIQDASVRAETVKMMDNANLREKQEKKQRQNAAGDELTQWLLDGGSLQTFRSERPEAAAQVSTSDALSSARLEVLVATGGQFATTTNTKRWSEILEMGATDRLALNPELEKANLDQSTHAQFLLIRKADVAAGDRASPHFATYKQGEQAVKNAWNRTHSDAEVKWGKGGQGLLDEQNALISGIRDYIQTTIDDPNQRVEPAGVNAEVDRLMTQMETQGFLDAVASWLPGGEDPFLTGFSDEAIVAEIDQLTDEEKREFSVDFDDISSEAVAASEAALKAAGVPVTEANVVEHFSATITRDRERALAIKNPKAPRPGVVNLGGAEGEVDVRETVEALRVETQALPPAAVSPDRTPTPEEDIVGQGPPPTTEEFIEVETVAPIATKSDRTPPAIVTPDHWLRQREVTANFEGIELSSYTDSKGFRTVGIGFNLDRSGARKEIEALGYDFKAVKTGAQDITREDAFVLFEQDITNSRFEADRATKDFSDLPADQQIALTDVFYNMGATKLRKKFPKLWAALKIGDIARVADELEFVDGLKKGKKSQWTRDVGPRRSVPILKMLRGE